MQLSRNKDHLKREHSCYDKSRLIIKASSSDELVSKTEKIGENGAPRSFSSRDLVEIQCACSHPLAMSLSRRRSSRDPIDIDFTLRRVFGKASFR